MKGALREVTLRRLGLLPLASVAALLLLFAANPVSLAASPLPAGQAVAPVTTPAPSGAVATRAPCPNPTPSPTPTLAPGQTPGPTVTRHPNLCPAQPNGADPFSLLAWAFTPIFQIIFLVLVFFYNIVGDIGIAIILVTLLIRLLLVPVYRAQIVSQRRMQMLQPELKAISQKFKGDRQKVSEEQMRLYKERGVNPASGCLPTVLTMVLLLPMYSVFSSGLTAPNISSMLSVFGVQIVHVTCQAAAGTNGPCIQPHIWWLGGLPADQPEILFRLPVIGFGLSLLALVSALLQLLQTRMMMPSSSDPQAQAQQRAFLLLPLLSLVYGSFLPAGLFIYWIVTTIFSIVQQYLIAGWGSLFPLFGWTPSFAVGHTPRFAPPPPKLPALGTGKPTAAPTRRDPRDSAAGTVRPNRERARTSRRGRRR
ncbi:MAG: YidC/Oxa1 family membrane protein insertase [Candidatus Limnocylindrales bacterium]